MNGRGGLAGRRGRRHDDWRGAEGLAGGIGASYLLAMSAGTDVFFERVLLPHRSLQPRGFHILMLLLGFVSLAVGIGFVSIGAWPVCGFFGLDVALIYLAFRLSYRSARQREILRLADDAFTVERVDIYGERRVWQFQPFWLRVILLERPDSRTGCCWPRTAKACRSPIFSAPRCAANWPRYCARSCRAGAPR